MKPDEVKSLVALALSNFPNLQDKNMAPTVQLWKEMLSDMPFDVAKVAVIKVLATAKFWPTVAEIREAAAEIMNQAILSPAEAWGQVIRAVQRYGYYRADEGMADLEPTVRKTVRAFGGFVEICQSENIDVVRSQFMRMYEQYAAREKEMAILPNSVKEFIKSLPVPEEDRHG